MEFSGFSFQRVKFAALKRLPCSEYGRMRDRALQPLIQVTLLPEPVAHIDGGKPPIAVS